MNTRKAKGKTAGGRKLLCLVMLLAVAASVLPAAVSADPPAGGSGHRHRWEKLYEVDATCTEEGYIILDTRAQDEYDAGHIPGAIVIPHDEIADRAEKELPQKDQLLLVYCRSGRRSKIAAEALVELGYTNIKEFGGIIDWPYEVE